jgi:acyl dehydratase
MSIVAALKPGDSLPAMEFPPITRATLALYCGGSGDHNPIHVDIDYARSHGLDDVIVHGMLVKAYIGRALTAVIDQQRFTQFDTQFLAPTHVGDTITVSAIVDSIAGKDETTHAIIKAEARNQKGTLLAKSMLNVNFDKP